MIRHNTLHRLFKVLVIILPVSTAVIIACGYNGDHDDNGGDGGGGDLCPIAGEDMIEVLGDVYSSGYCSVIGLTIVKDKVLWNPTKTVFQMKGQYAIGNNNTYYLRGAGIDENACFEELHGAGAFSILTEIAECTNYIFFDVVATLDPEAAPLCSYEVTLYESCDLDDDADDDAFDNESCVQGLTFLYDCGYAIYDTDGNELSLVGAIDACENGDSFVSCAAECGLAFTCDSLESCVGENCA